MVSRFAAVGLLLSFLLPRVSSPPQEAVEPDVVARLGERLFFDPVLSVDRSVSCSSCHDPDRNFADAVPRSEGVLGRRTLRNTPTLVNRVHGESFMWDGRFDSLEEQVLQPIENELEMGLPVADAVARLATDATWSDGFERAFGGAPTRDRLAAALAAYVRTIRIDEGPVDRFRAGDYGALTDEERLGLWFFESRGRCWRCHSGANFTDESFHNTGVGAVSGRPEAGREAVTGVAADRGRFKTPTLRGVAKTAPYMHGGSLATLEEVVRYYRRGGDANDHLDPRLQPIEMSERDVQNLVRFLEALSR